MSHHQQQFITVSGIYYEPRREKTCLRGLRTTKAQTDHSGGWGGGGGNSGVILVRVCEPIFFKPTLIINLVFEKKYPIHILD